MSPGWLWRFVADCAAGGGEVVLIDAVAGDAQAAHQLAIEIKWSASGKEDDSVLVGVLRLRALGAGVQDIFLEERKERAWRGAVDPLGIERLGGEIQGSIRDGGADGGPPGGLRIRCAAEVEDIARLCDGNVDAEEGGIRHAIEGEQRAVEVGNCDHEASARSDREADSGPGEIAGSDGVGDDTLHLGQGEAAKAAAVFGDEVAFGGGSGAVERAVAEAADCCARGVAGGQGGLVDKGQRDAIDNDGSRGRDGGGKAVEERRGDRGPLDDGRIVGEGGVTDNTDASGNAVVFEDRDAARIDRVWVRVEEIGLAGKNAETGEGVVESPGTGRLWPGR